MRKRAASVSLKMFFNGNKNATPLRNASKRMSGILFLNVINIYSMILKELFRIKKLYSFSDIQFIYGRFYK